MTFIGIDLGTSGLRAILVDAKGRPIGAASRGYAQSHPQPGWSEQDPADWINAASAALAELRDRFAEFRDLRGIGVAAQMHGATLLDSGDRVIRPCILWNDTRSHAEAARMDADPAFRQITGNIVFPGFTAPKLEWLRQHEPVHHARVARVLLPAAYLTLWLTGDRVSDMSDSAGTSWFDTGRRDWSDALLTASNMSRSQMPRLVEGSEPAGHLRPELARDWGLTTPVVVAGGAGDNAAAACGLGAMTDGQGSVSLGTSGVLMVARDGFCPAPQTALHSFCHAVPGKWYQMGVILSATESLNWLAGITGATPADLTHELGDDLQPPGPVRFLPYLAGERTPHNDPMVRGSLTGLGAATSRRDLTRAVIEGVAFALRDSHEALKSVGARPERLWAIGGGARSEYWLRVLATVLDTTLLIPEGGLGDAAPGAALGAARLGMIAARAGSLDEVMTCPGIRAEIRPDPALRAAFEDGWRAYRGAYPAIRAVQ